MGKKDQKALLTVSIYPALVLADKITQCMCELWCQEVANYAYLALGK